MRQWFRAIAAAVLAVAATVVVAPAPAQAETIRQMQQWYLDAVQAPQAQKVSKGDGIVVGVIDTGVDAGHHDLAGAVLPGITFSGSGSEGGRTDPDGHGTKMAGIIAARGGGENNALGIAPKAKILPVAVPAKDFGSLAQPIRWAVDHGAKVINLSVGHPVAAPADEVAAIAYAAAKDVVVVSAAGNQDQGFQRVGSPASIPGVVAVAGIDRTGQSWSGSAHGPEVAVAAPAENIVNAGARNINSTGYAGGGATSEASAIVSGVAALIRAKFPKLNAANVVNRLVRTATDEGDPGRDPLYGFGVVNAQRALTANVAAVTANPLGAPATAATTDDGTVAGDGDGGPLGSPGARLALVVGVALAVVLIFVLIIVLIVRRSSRRRPVVAGPRPPTYAPPGRPGAPGYPPPPAHPGPPGYPPASAPPGYRPVPGYPPPPSGYPPPGGYPPPPPGAPPAGGYPPQPPPPPQDRR